MARVALAAGIAFAVASALPRLQSSVDVARVEQALGLDEAGPVRAFFLELRGAQPPDDQLQPRSGSTSDLLTAILKRLGLYEMDPGALPAVSRAYRAQFGHSLDEDLAEHQDEVEAWLIKWKAAYRRGEPWARALVNP